GVGLVVQGQGRAAAAAVQSQGAAQPVEVVGVGADVELVGLRPADDRRGGRGAVDVDRAGPPGGVQRQALEAGRGGHGGGGGAGGGGGVGGGPAGGVVVQGRVGVPAAVNGDGAEVVEALPQGGQPDGVGPAAGVEGEAARGAAVVGDAAEVAAVDGGVVD